MAEPLRDRILDLVVTKLQGMTGVRPWGGSYPANPTVTRWWAQIQQIEKNSGTFPHFIVLEAPGSTFELESTETATHARAVHRFKVTIACYIKGNVTATRSRWLQRAWDDVRNTFMKDSQLGGQVRNLTLESSLDTDTGEHDPLGAFAQELTIEADEVVEVG